MIKVKKKKTAAAKKAPGKKKKASSAKESPVKRKKVSAAKKAPAKKKVSPAKIRRVKKSLVKKTVNKKKNKVSGGDKAFRKKHLGVIVTQLKEEKLFVQERVEKSKRDEWISEGNDEIDNAVASAERDILFERVDRLIQRLDEIENALKKAELRKFGTCEKCGMDITIKRLKLIPYARFCYRCISKD
ncbi:TraR/DksA C4-type zinc finger protein [bacterium]|nr:hypothetical protein [bacterium]MBU3955322.1 TraR/DksA C4-type zinc finger protein [bacterium]